MIEILKMLARKKMLDILNLIRDSDGISFSRIMFTLTINPGMLSKNLAAAVNLGLIEKNGSSYKITERGRIVLAAAEMLKKVSDDEA